MYAPHASPAHPRLAEFVRTPAEFTDPLLAGDLSVDPLTPFPSEPSLALPVAGAVVAVLAVLVTIRLLHAHPVGMSFVLPGRARRGRAPSRAWFGVGSALVGLTALEVLGGGWRGTAVSVAFAVAGAVFLPALLLVPGAAPDTARRPARALDGVLVGLSLMFVVWVLVVAPHGGAGGVTFWAVMFHCCVIGNAVVVGVAASPRTARLRVPVLAVPVALALVAALVRIVTGGHLDPGSALIGVLAAAAVGVRHLLPELPAAPAAAPAAPSGSAAVTPTRSSTVVRPSSGSTLATAISALCAGRQGSLIAVGSRGGIRGEELARRVRELVDEDATVAAIGNDVAVLTGANVLQAYGVAHHLVTALGPETVRASAGLTELAVEASPGVGAGGSGPAVGVSEEVVRRAVVALRRSEQLGPGRIEWYDPSVEEATRRAEAIEQALPAALRKGELHLIYQPIVELTRGRPTAVEALLRWRHPTLGQLPPSDVIPVAVRTGAMGELGHWVFRQATRQLATWRRAGRDISMAINVTPVELAGLGPELGAMLAAQGVPADRLVLEIAESRIEDCAALAEHVGELRAVGVRTALDAFGAQPASLAHLRRLPIDMVKIGQSFFGGPAALPRPRQSAEQAPLVDLLVGVGRRLGVDVVAHGLEQPAQLEVARMAGCRMGQGHLFARPQPAEHTEAYLDGFR